MAILQREYKRIRAVCNAGQDHMGQATGKYGRGLASEGYVGGYVAALSHVLLFLNAGVEPDDNFGLWQKSSKP